MKLLPEWFTNSADEIDAAIFSGDTFVGDQSVPIARRKAFCDMLERWQRGLDEHAAMSADAAAEQGAPVYLLALHHAEGGFVDVLSAATGEEVVAHLTKGVEPVAKKGLAVIVALFADGQAAWCGVDDAGKGGLGGLVASEYAVARLESTVDVAAPVNVPAWALPVKSSWNHHNGDPTPRESHYKSPVAIGHPQPVGEMGEVLFNIRNHVE